MIEAIPQLVNENKGGLGDLIKKNYGSAEECQIEILQVILNVYYYRHNNIYKFYYQFYIGFSCLNPNIFES